MHLESDRIYHLDLFSLCDRLSDESADMILCDLPYGVTKAPWDVVIPLDGMWERFCRIIKPRGAIVLTASQPFTSKLVMSNMEIYRHAWVWNKGRAPNFLNANQEPMKIHEDILVFSRESAMYYPQMRKGVPHVRGGKSKTRDNGTVYGQRTPVHYVSEEYYPHTILDFPTIDNAKKVHPTEKPVLLFEYLIRTYTREGDLVVDPCVGSGTTAIAARNLRRHYICGDTSAEYIETARRRLEAPHTPYMFAIDE